MLTPASKWKLAQIWAILLWFPFLVFVGSVTGSSSPPRPIAQEYTQQSTAQSTAQESIADISAKIVARYTKVLAWFTGLLAVVSIVQGFFIYLQVRAQRAEFVASHPPNLITRRFQFKEAEVGTYKWGVEFVIVNKGLTMTKISEDRITISCLPVLGVQEIKQRSFPEYNSRMNILEKREYAPFERQAHFVHITDMTDETLSKIRMGLVVVVAFGSLKYIDPAKVERVSLFWREYNHSTGRFDRYDDPDYDNSDKDS